MMEIFSAPVKLYEMRRITICYDFDYTTNLFFKLTDFEIPHEIINHIIGFLIVGTGEICQKGDEYCVSSLFVHENFRRKGVALKMLKYTEKVMGIKLRPELVTSNAGTAFFDSIKEIRKMIKEALK